MTSLIPDPLAPDAGLLGHVLEVAQVRRETADAVSLTFAVPSDLAATFAFRAGQFLTLAVPSDRTGWVSRCYSISSDPAEQQQLTVTVKRTADGYASAWLCEHVSVGDRLRVLPPSGLFTLRSPESDVLLCAAGSGITPAMALLRDVLASVTGRVALFYANPDPEATIFLAELAQLRGRYGDRLVVEHWWESERGLPTREGLAAWADPYAEREVLCCGPAPFMALVRDAVAAAGFDPERVRTEEYRSLAGDPFAPPAALDAASLSDAADARVLLDGREHRVVWPRSRTLVDALAAAGVDAPWACREGSCGACTCLLAEGEVDQARTTALDAEDLAVGYILGCQATPVSSLVRVEF